MPSLKQVCSKTEWIQSVGYALTLLENDANLSSLRIISKRRLIDFCMHHSRAKNPLERWNNVTEAAHWKNFQEVRRTFGSTDRVIVESKRTVVIFDIGGNKYRLISAIHYNMGRVFILRTLTHAEYDENTWRKEL